jgi:hypothetical protein
MDTKTHDPREPLVMAAQLTLLFARQGVHIHYRYARELIAACPHSVRKRYIKFSDAWSWWVLNPGFRPFSEQGEPDQGSLAGSLGNPT